MHRLRQAHSQEAGSGSCSGMVGITTPCFSPLAFHHLPFHSQEWAFILGKLWGEGRDLGIPPGVNPPAPPQPHERLVGQVVLEADKRSAAPRGWPLSRGEGGGRLGARSDAISDFYYP